MSRADTPRRVLASFLIATGLLVAVLPGVASADNTDVSGDGVQAGPGGAVIKDRQNLVKAAGGCALIVQGGKTVSAGDCSGGSASRPPATTPTPKAPTDHSPSKTTATTPPDPKTASTGVSTPAPDTRTTTSLTNGTTSGRGKTEDQLCASGPPKDALKAKVGRAVDGDTLQLDRKIDGKDRVRLIGVDTPELHGKNGDPEPYAEATANFTSDQLKGKDVLLVPGRDNTDDYYHRLLAYVWTTPGDGVIGTVKGMLGGGPALFNRTLVDKGYAKVMTIPPNDRYAACFEAAERSARSAGEGRWRTSTSTMGATTVTNLDPTATTMSSTSATPGPAATSQQSTNPAPTTSSTVVKPQEVTSLERTSSPTAPLTSATTNGGTSTTPSTIPEATTSTPSPTATTVSASTSEQATQPVPTPRVEPLVAPQATTQVDQPAPTSQPPLPDTWPPPASQSQPVAAPSTIPYQSLPQSTTPMGETQRLLPDTGGRSPIFLLVGAALVGVGLLIWRGRPDEHSAR